jgi:hypothetical protein
LEARSADSLYKTVRNQFLSPERKEKLVRSCGQKIGKVNSNTMRDLETDAVPRPTKELLENAIQGITNKLAILKVAVYQEIRNNRVETGARIAANLDSITTAVNLLKEIKGTL